MVLKRLFNVVRGFLLFSNVHGFCYVADREIHWIGRLFWLTCIILCYIASYFLILSSWDNYENNSISFVSDTAYLHWETTLPAIVVCEIESNLADDYAEELWGEEGSIYAPDIFNEIGFFRGTASLVKDQCSEESNYEPCNMDYKTISEKLRRNCSSLFKKCLWNDIEFDCCTYFRPLQTELGLCYALNSIQTGDITNSSAILKTRRNESHPGKLVYHFTSTIETYILSSEEVPSLQIPDYEYKANPGNRRKYFVSVKEIDNEVAVRNIAMKHRKCRYPDESYLTVQKYYSLMGCIIEERKKEQYKFCNCTHQLMPNPNKICDLNGLLCIYRHYDDVTVIKPVWSKKQGLTVDCLPSCVEDEVTVIHVKKEYIRNNGDYGEVIIQMTEWPSERFKRTVIRGKLDLVVSIGGTVGLFIGASVLSIVEIFYYFGFRIWTKTNAQQKQDTNEQLGQSQFTNINNPRVNSSEVTIHKQNKLQTKDKDIVLMKPRVYNVQNIKRTPTYAFSYYE